MPNKYRATNALGIQYNNLLCYAGLLDSGSLSREETMKVLIQLGEDPNDEANLHKIIDEIDLSGDNEIDAEEVRTFVCQRC